VAKDREPQFFKIFFVMGASALIQHKGNKARLAGIAGMDVRSRKTEVEEQMPALE
jgi:hypothetical protein